MTRYRVDGIFINRWDGSGMCYCEHCRENFRAATGLELPTTDDPQDPVPACLRPLAPAAPLRALAALGRGGPQDQPRLVRDPERRRRRDEPARHEADRRARADAVRRPAGAEGAHAAVGQRQERQGIPRPMGRKPIGGIFSVGVEEAYRWKDSVQSQAEIRIWVADGVANGLRPWFTKFAGTLHDPPLAEAGRGPLPLAPPRRALPAERGAAGPGRPGLLAADRLVLRGTAQPSEVEDPALGWYQALDRGAGPLRDGPRPAARRRAPVSQFKTLILPNIAALSDAQCRQLRRSWREAAAWWRPTRRRSTTNGAQRRPDFGLADLFGATWKGRIEGPMRNAYLRLEDESHAGASAPGGPGRCAADHPRGLAAGRRRQRTRVRSRR